MIAALASYRPRPSTTDCRPYEEDDSDEYERRPRGRSYRRRSTLRPEDNDEALWTVAPHELCTLEDEDDEMPGLYEGSSTRSLPIPISPSPLRHPYFDPSRDDVSIVLSTTEQPISSPQDTKAARQVFQKGQSFYNGWLHEYVAAHH
ncbi:hypothetical protein PIIN_11144 [Serendipita indica DSM 11827]|uniref:Uncharacterized protein n=1 Tax=Serendipita indica (strain DSM 11827) TaxID=1109443 RepID=G4U0R9_SERID|nr:hypothetical protein PIIN_11144 [Serendipita indica DSM 11827]